MAWFDPPLYRLGNKKCPYCGEPQGGYRFVQNRRKPWLCPKCRSALIYDRRRMLVNWILLVPVLCVLVLAFVLPTPLRLLGLLLAIGLLFAATWWLESYRLKSTPERTDEKEVLYNSRGSLASVPWIMWGLMMAALVIFIVVGKVVGSDGVGNAGDANLVRLVLYVMSAIMLGIAFLLRWAFRKRIRSIILRNHLTIVIPGALCLSIGIYGLILCLINSDFVSLYVLVAIAAASLVFMRPSSEGSTAASQVNPKG